MYKNYENVCWYCGAKLSADFCWTCSRCGWLICSKCGHCKDERKGHCKENNKGNDRYTGIYQKKNYLKNFLMEHNCLTRSLFDQMKSIWTERDYEAFRQKNRGLIVRMQQIFKREEEEKKEKRRKILLDKQRELEMNRKGFYKVIYHCDSYTTYCGPKGFNETINGRVRIIGNYVYIENRN